VKRTAMPGRRKPLAPGRPLERTRALRRAAILHGTELARAAAGRRRRPAPAGGFSPRVRRLLWRRFAGRCAVCGGDLPAKGWTAQHRRARGIGGSTDPVAAGPANGLAVHELPCHRAIEDKPATALVMGWRVPQGVDPAARPLCLWDGTWVLLTNDGTTVPARPEEST
jgi:hypothetical protein